MVNKNFLVVVFLFYEPLGGERPNGGESHSRVFAFFGAQKPNPGVEFFTDFFFFLRFFWFFDKALAHTF